MERLERLIRELEASALDEGLRHRCDEALTAGYAEALAIEGRRRRLRERQRELLAEGDGGAAAIEELVGVARRELDLVREEKALRELLGRLRRRERAAMEARQPPRRALGGG